MMEEIRDKGEINLILVFGQFARIKKKRIRERNRLLVKTGEMPEIRRDIRLGYAQATLEPAAEHFAYAQDYLSRTLKNVPGRVFRASSVESGSALHRMTWNISAPLLKRSPKSSGTRAQGTF